MLKLFLPFCLLLLQLTASATPFNLHIRVPDGIPLNKLIVSYGDGIKTIDLQDDKVSRDMVLKGDLHSLYGSLFFAIRGADEFFTAHETFFFGPGNSEVVLKDTSLQKNHLVNVWHSDKEGAALFKKYSEKEDAEELTAQKAFNKKSDSPELYQELKDKVTLQRKKYIEFINTNPSLYYSFFKFYTWVNGFQQDVAPDSLLEVYKRFPEKYRNTDVGKKLYADLNNWILIKQKSLAANFNTKDIHNNPVSVDALKGKYVIIDFWATWCGPCMNELPQLKAMYQKYSPDKLKVISVAREKDTTKYRDALKNLPEEWLHVLDLDDTISQTYGLSFIPMWFVIDPDGKIVWTHHQAPETDFAELDKYLSSRL